MTIGFAFVAGAVTVAVTWLLARRAFASERFARTNYRGRAVPTAAGALLVTALLWAPTDLGGADRDALVVTVVGLAALGLLDDLAGSEDRGFRGHLRALRRGRVTTGMVKLAGGLAVGLLAAWLVGRPASAGLRLADGALIALAANLGNLFDRAPGRAVKVGLLAFAALTASTAADEAIAGIALVAGGAAGLLVFDLRERLMLGDAGANALGGALGLGVVLACTSTARLVVLTAVAAANVASEVVSFSRVIDAVAPLRVADRAGRAR